MKIEIAQQILIIFPTHFVKICSAYLVVLHKSDTEGSHVTAYLSQASCFPTKRKWTTIWKMTQCRCHINNLSHLLRLIQIIFTK